MMVIFILFFFIYKNNIFYHQQSYMKILKKVFLSQLKEYVDMDFE